MASIEEIAHKAGVSTSTVSRVLNRPETVTTGTRDIVHSVMRDLEFVPPARKSRNNYTIGLAVSDISIPLLTKMIPAIVKELDDYKHDLLVLNMKSKNEITKFFREHLRFRKKIDGLIIFSANVDDECVSFFRSMEIPVVLLHTVSDKEKSISTNHYLGAFDAVEFLISRGYGDIAFIGWEPQDHTGIDRFSGYKSSLTKAGLPFVSENTAFAKLSLEGGYQATAELFRSRKPEAVFYACDTMAFGGYQYFRENHIDVPGDVGIVGFDNLEIAAVFGLTTMDQFVQAKLRKAVAYLMGRIDGTIESPLDEEICITPKIVVRKSTR